MSAVENCSIHGEWVDDGTTTDCPECLGEMWAQLRAAKVAELQEIERDLQIIRDPWLRRGLGRRRRELKDSLSDNQ